MKTLLLATSLLLAGVGNAFATAATAATGDTQAPAYEQVDGFRFYGHLDSWHAIDDDTLIVWATPSQPYLVELMTRSRDLRYSQVIGVTSTVGRVTDLDSVFVRGWNYPIKAIYKLDPDQAEQIQRT